MAASLVSLSAASFSGMLEYVGIYMRITLRDGRTTRVCVCGGQVGRYELLSESQKRYKYHHSWIGLGCRSDR